MKQGVKRLLSMALALVAIVGSFVVFFNGIQPEYENLAREQGQLASLERLAQDRQTAVLKVEELIGEYSGENAEKLKASISSALPRGVDMASALVQIVGIMRLSNVTVDSISPKVETVPATNPTQIVKPVGMVTYEISAQGNYGSLKDFFSKLETNTMLFDVRSMGLRPVRTGSDVLRINLTVVSYYQSQ
ncbi:MAG: hypothetical protein KGZ30_02710 [Anaplasmataceae bacterium]|nr:hypothetical protein [Anaplasmataceae bacterium]